VERARFEEIRDLCGERLAAALGATDERFDGWVDRMERSEQHFIEALAENSAEIKQFGERMGKRLAELSEGYEDGREEMRANTRAILSILDRLDGLEGGSAST